ncbi:MAG: hypothetical protein HN633_14400 [Candidatus Marinimicrobia bacterium]|nr:hypothetical protein [Candidatus Neomarinimicrobiota bacterium]
MTSRSVRFFVATPKLFFGHNTIVKIQHDGISAYPVFVNFMFSRILITADAVLSGEI